MRIADAIIHEHDTPDHERHPVRLEAIGVHAEAEMTLELTELKVHDEGWAALEMHLRSARDSLAGLLGIESPLTLAAGVRCARTSVGVVPQDDVVHSRLTARSALTYAARLRLPDDTGAAARRHRVTETLAEVGLAEHARKPIHRLSGGQRKRVSIALELLTAPSLLMLDEPTSGLDPALDKQIMGRLRELADAGRTVVVVTHNVTNPDDCDRVLLLAPGGVPVFSGRPAELRARFGTADWAEIFERVVSGTAPPQQPAPVVPADAPEPAGTPAAGQRRAVAPGRHAGRHLRLILADPGYAMFLPVVLAVLALAVPGHEGLRPSGPEHPTEAAQMLVLVFVGAAFMGASASAREAVAERAIFLRERAVGLRPGAYAVAKAGVFTIVAAVQSAVLVGVVVTVKPGPVSAVLLPRPAAELAAAVWLTALASCLLGLLGSALVRSIEQTTPVLVVTVMAQLVLCGGMIPVTGRPVLAQLSWLAPARWGYAAGASTVDLRQGGRRCPGRACGPTTGRGGSPRRVRCCSRRRPARRCSRSGRGDCAAPEPERRTG